MLLDPAALRALSGGRTISRALLNMALRENARHGEDTAIGSVAVDPFYARDKQRLADLDGGGCPRCRHSVHFDGVWLGCPRCNYGWTNPATAEAEVL